MKLFSKALYILGVAAVIASCDTLEQASPSSFEGPSVFSNYDLARLAVNGIYEAYVVTSAYRSDWATYYGANTDVEIWTQYSGTDEKSGICKYRTMPTNQYLNKTNSYDFFPAVYNSIERANVCIKNLREYGNVENKRDMANLLGEALTIRAVLYADLLNYYGEVPARFEPITAETIYLPKSDRDVIYKQLLGDLEEAAGLMRFDQTTITRGSKALALGLYARLALQAAGYALRPDEGKVNTGDLGTIRKSSDPELQADILYPKAIAHLQEIIDSGKYELFENFEDLWHYFCNLKTTVDASGSEMIYSMPFGLNRGQFIYHNGVKDTKYGFSRSVRKAVCPTLYFKYPEGDKRRDVSCCWLAWGSSGDVASSSISGNYCYFGKLRFDWMVDHPYREQNAEDGAKVPVLRYADVFLMAAEMANEMGELDAAKEYLRPVLNRAYGDVQEAEYYLETLTDHDTFFEAIKDQRAFEFCGECLRKQDLIRWGILGETLDKAMDDIKALKDRSEGSLSEGLRDALYWRYMGDKSDHYKVEVKFVKEAEDEPLVSDGWTKVDKIFSGISSHWYSDHGLYMEEFYPDQYMYRPIPASIITASLGTIVNDYGYNLL